MVLTVGRWASKGMHAQLLKRAEKNYHRVKKNKLAPKRKKMSGLKRSWILKIPGSLL
jgi:hypothetical protein